MVLQTISYLIEGSDEWHQGFMVSPSMDRSLSTVIYDAEGYIVMEEITKIMRGGVESPKDKKFVLTPVDGGIKITLVDAGTEKKRMALMNSFDKDFSTAGDKTSTEEPLIVQDKQAPSVESERTATLVPAGVPLEEANVHTVFPVNMLKILQDKGISKQGITISFKDLNTIFHMGGGQWWEMSVKRFDSQEYERFMVRTESCMGNPFLTVEGFPENPVNFHEDKLALIAGHGKKVLRIITRQGDDYLLVKMR